MQRKRTETVPIMMTEDEIKLLDEKVKQCGFDNRSDLIRFLIKKAEIKVIADRTAPDQESE